MISTCILFTRRKQLSQHLHLFFWAKYLTQANTDAVILLFALKVFAHPTTTISAHQNMSSTQLQSILILSDFLT